MTSKQGFVTLSMDLITELNKVLKKLDKDTNIGSIVLTG